MSALAAFHDQLLPELPGCGTAMVNRHLVDTARQFCTDTSAWRATFTPVNLVAAQAAYTLVTGVTDSEVVRLTKLTASSVLLWLDRDVTQFNRIDEPKYEPNNPPFSLDGALQVITLITDEISAGNVTAGLVIEGALKPTLAAATLPDFLLNTYSEALRFGTLSRLMRMAAKPWAAPALAVDYGSEYQKLKNFAAYQGQVGNTRQVLRTRNWG